MKKTVSILTAGALLASAASAAFAAALPSATGTYLPGGFSHIIWVDENSNNTFDDGEKGVEGAIVDFLKSPTHEKIQTAQTDANGQTDYADIENGSYVIRVTLPEDYKYYNCSSAYDLEGDAAFTLDDIGDSSFSYDYTMSVDRGVTIHIPVHKMSDPYLMGYVWHDVNENGKRPAFQEWEDKNDEPDTEKGVGGITITVYDKDGNKLADGETAGDGSYGFEIPVGIDTVTATLTGEYSDYGFTTPEGGTITREMIEGEEMVDFGIAEGYTSQTAGPTLVPAVRMTPGPTEEPDEEATPTPTTAPTEVPTATPSPTYVPGDPPQLNKTEHYAYVVGYDDGTIRPENNITRQEVATIFFRLLEDSSRDYFYSKSNDFSDVPTTLWSNTAISTMSNAKIITGYLDGTFLPTNNITRAEFATISAKFDSSSYIGPDKFSDIGGHWAAEYINRAAQKGWISGYEDGTFRPNDYITRAEAMTLINRVLEREVKNGDMLSDMTVWPDNTSDKWYYSAIQEATNSHYYEKESGAKYEVWTSMRETRDWTELEKK